MPAEGPPSDPQPSWDLDDGRPLFVDGAGTADPARGPQADAAPAGSLAAQLRATLDRDIDEQSVSLVPPAALTGMLAQQGEAMAVEAYRIHAGHLLRRLVRGMPLDEVRALAASYLGMSEAGVRQVLADLRRVTGYADRIVAGTIPRNQAIAQMMTWKNADRRLVDGLLDEVLAVYRREGIASFAVPSDDGEADGEVRNNSYATSAPHVELQFRRLVHYDPLLRAVVPRALLMLAVSVTALVAAIALAFDGRWVWAIVALAIASRTSRWALALRHLPKMHRFLTEVFDSALLTGGLIEQVEPLSLLCIAEMGNGAGPTFYGIRRLRGIELPGHRLRVGEAVPCVSHFTPGEHDDRWSDFTPRPIAWGTDDEAQVRDLLVKLGDQDLAILRRCIAARKLPEDDDLLVLDGETLEPVAG